MMSALIIFFIAIGMITIGWFQLKKSKHLLAHGKIANGIIFTNNYKHSRKGGTYYPVVRFLTDKHEWITQELDTGYSSAMEEGTQVEVIYDPEDPTYCAINSQDSLKIVPWVFLVIGVCGFVFGVLELLEVIDIVH